MKILNEEHFQNVKRYAESIYGAQNETYIED